MISRDYALKDKKDFERVEKLGDVFQSECFGIAILKRDDLLKPKFAFIVSTKISKLSVQRNRIKRALSEAVRYDVSRIKPGYDVVFLAKQSAVKKSTDLLMKEVDKALFDCKLAS